MGLKCTKNRKTSSKILNHDDDGDFRLRKTTTFIENKEKNFRKGAYYFNKQEEK